MISTATGSSGMGISILILSLVCVQSSPETVPELLVMLVASELYGVGMVV